MDQLSRDAKEARAAGLSYGQYIGLRYEARMKAEAEERRHREEAKARRAAERAAALAKAEAEAKAQASKRRGYNYQPVTRVCIWCGKEFQTVGTRKLCSAECKAARGRQLSRERNRQRRQQLKGELVKNG